MENNSKNAFFPGLLVLPFCQDPVQTSCSVAMWLWTLLPPVFLVLGTCGNFLNLVILSRKRLRAHSTTIFLLFLAVSDITILWCSFLRQWFLRVVDLDILNVSVFTCTVHIWMTYTSGAFSAWLLVLVTIERTFVIAWPVYSRGKVTRKNALISCISLLVIIMVFMGFFLFAFDMQTVPSKTLTKNDTTPALETVACLPRTKEMHEFIAGTWRIVVFIALNLLPLLIISTGNTIIAINLILYTKRRRRRIQPDIPAPSTLSKRTVSATKIPLFLCSFFLITTIPYTSFGVIKSKYFKDVTDVETNAHLQLAHAVTYVLLYGNYTFNFLLYFVTGTLFKTEWNEIVNTMKNRHSVFVIRNTEGITEVNTEVLTVEKTHRHKIHALSRQIFARTIFCLLPQYT